MVDSLTITCTQYHTLALYLCIAVMLRYKHIMYYALLYHQIWSHIPEKLYLAYYAKRCYSSRCAHFKWCFLYLYFCTGWGETLRVGWPDVWWMPRRTMWWQVCSVLLCQCDMPAVLLRILLGYYSFSPWTWIPQAPCQRRWGPAQIGTFPLVGWGSDRVKYFLIFILIQANGSVK